MTQLTPVLIIAYHFPPMASAGTFRTRALVRHMAAYGYRPVTITSRKPAFPIDETLLDGMPVDLPVYRCFAPEITSRGSRLSRMLQKAATNEWGARQSGGSGKPGPMSTFVRGIARINSVANSMLVPDSSIGWLPFGVKGALSAVRRHDCRLIYSTSPPWTSHLIALWTKRIVKLPWIADFRDPWRANPFRKIGYKALDRLDARLEDRVVNSADIIICNSEATCEDFKGRYPHISQRFVTVPNGFDPEDFRGLEPDRPVGPDRLLLTHTGTFYGLRQPDAILRALLPLQRELSALRPCLQLIGPPMSRGRPLGEIAEQLGVGEMVHVSGELSHRDALRRMQGSDILLVIGIKGKGAELQVPGKLYEYFGANRPILALAPQNSAISDTIKKCGIRACVCDSDDPLKISEAIRSLSQDLKSDSAHSPVSNGTFSQFDRRSQVAEISRIFDSAAFGLHQA